MAKTRVFVSFDYDHDESLRNLLVGQSKHSDSPFELVDWSIKEAIDKNWKEHARRRIRAVDVVAVICGLNTNTATGVDAEMQIAKEESISYFLLTGYADKNCQRPKAAKSTDKMYRWTWDNLKVLIGGGR